MLAEQRWERIMGLLEEKGSITVTEVQELLGISLSTARRDLTTLDQMGRLKKVFGGAVTAAADTNLRVQEPTVTQKAELYMAEKKKIAAYAASLIRPEEFVYLDAGTTTGAIVEYLQERDVTIVTNGVTHAQRLAQAGFHVYLVGGELKSSTEAVVGNFSMNIMQNFHFTRGYFGTNGISRERGLTTPDINEALVKKVAIAQCRECYILADHSKFDVVSAVTFAPLECGTILTDDCPEEYRDCVRIVP